MTKHNNLFWVTLTMKLQPLVELSLILILASYAKGEGWTVNVTKTIHANLGDNVTIQCTFTYPKKNHTKEPELHWKLRRESNKNNYDKQNNSIYLYHPNETHVEEKYRGRTKLIGNSSNGNCSLKIFNITDNEPNIYLRIVARDNYSFSKTPVSIYVSGATPVPTTPAIFTETTPQPPSGPMYAAIFVSAAAALIIIFVIGFFLFRHKSYSNRKHTQEFHTVLRSKTCCSCQMTKHHNLFWVTLTMKLQPLVELSLILILASYAKGEGWTVNVTKTIHAKLGDNVTIPCTFTYPKKNHTKEPELYWKLRRISNYDKYDKQNNSIYLYHPNEIHVEETYRGRTKLIGNSSNGNCSLKIFNITDNEPEIYLRLVAHDKYSFIKNPVSINVSGATPVTFNPGPMYAAIFVSAAAALIIIFVIGFFLSRHKREQSLTREDSGYYANFSRASSNQATRKELCKKQDNKELPDLKTFDDPVYINMEAPAGQMDQHVDQSVDHTDNIYANMDYHK